MGIRHQTKLSNKAINDPTHKITSSIEGSLSEPDWLGEAHPLSEGVSSLSKYETLENVELESSKLSTQPARPVRILSLLALSAQPLTLAQ
ncbi:hypothetical protein glysoja_009130 [Glycine soja]|nr:hypothetical protein glysoja_009130 [Glycine soja]